MPNDPVDDKDLKAKKGQDAITRMFKNPDQKLETLQDQVDMLLDVQAISDYLELD